MTEFTSEILSDVLAACNAGAGETAAALSRTLDAQITLAAGDAAIFKLDSLPEDLRGPGLAILFTVGSSGAVFVVPESSSLVPPWCAAPDATGQSKLATLAQELGMNLLPEAFMPENSKAIRVENIAETLLRGEIGENAAAISLSLSTLDGRHAVARMIWPLAKPAMITDAPIKAEPAPAAASGVQVNPPAQPTAKRARPRRLSLDDLPSYTKSLLRIKVPVVVTLAEKKQPLSQIVEMGPGMIIQFEKSCEEALQLEVGKRKIAAGEAIKVGDKFGLRVASIILPEERFKPVKGLRS